MFFPAFTSNSSVHLPRRLAFLIEYQASQVLIGADTDFLAEVLKNRKLPIVLFLEVEASGQIPRSDLQRIELYFISHKETLNAAAQRLIAEPGNSALRKGLLKPSISQDEFNQFLEVS